MTTTSANTWSPSSEKPAPERDSVGSDAVDGRVAEETDEQRPEHAADEVDGDGSPGPSDPVWTRPELPASHGRPGREPCSPGRGPPILLGEDGRYGGLGVAISRRTATVPVRGT